MSGDFTSIHVSVSKNIEGEVMLRINQLAGTITLIEQEGNSRTGINAAIPQKQVADFKTWVQNISGGQGSVSEVG